MNLSDALAQLALLDASGDHVMVSATFPDGRSFGLFDSPRPAAEAIIGVNAAHDTAASAGHPISDWTVRRDETAIGITH